MVTFDRDALSIDVGTRLKELREARNISMRTLAMKSGLSANALSMIERGRTSPSVSTLYKLSDALGVSITAFFATELEKKQVIYLKSSERTRIAFTRGTFEALGGEQFTGRMEPFMLTLENSASSGPHTITHSGHEFVLCLRGELDYQVERETFHLMPGDSLLFAAQLKHKWKNPGKTVTNALIVLSDFAEGEQPNAMHWRKSE